MQYCLDGADWEADYFISDADCVHWQMAPWNLHNMLLDNASGSGFISIDGGYDASFKATVPGCDRSVLLANGVIADPFFNRNMDHSRWSEKAAWAFRKRFVLPDEMKAKKHFQLRFCGIDYRAAFFLNDQYLGHHQGAFLPFESDVTDYIRPDGENMIAVVFDPMPQALPNHTDPFEQKNTEFSAFHRSQMSYGWDWSRAMAAAGIWDHVWLKACDDVRIEDFFFRAQGTGDVELLLDIQAHESGAYPLRVKVEPMRFDGKSYEFEFPLDLKYGEVHTAVRFNCPEPALWYPNGYGPQNLYKLTLELDGYVVTAQVAFRTLEMRRNAKSPEKAYDLTFTVNGKEIFARGSNWVPADMMYCRCGEEEYERLVRLAAENNTNIFRIWGGGIIEKDEFYAACDRYGIMVWQEFMHACSSYPKDPEYLAFKAREADAVLRKIRNHVCISMICGGNELLYYGEIPDSPLLRQYRQITADMAPDLPFHTTSPDRSRPGERDHGPWHFIEHAEINKHDRLLASELGCPGFPEFDSVKKFIPEADWERPLSQSWKYHFAIPRGAQGWQVQAAVFDAKNSAELCQAVMATQSNMLCYWMTHCRRKFPHTTGCFIWQYNEPWPTLSLSYVDYYTRPKMAYYHLRRVQQNTILSLQEDSWFCRNGKFSAGLFMSSDNDTGVLNSSFRLLTADGQVLWEKTYTGCGKTGSVKLDDIAVEIPAEPVGGVVLAEMRIAENGKTVFSDTQLYGVPDFKKVFTAPAPELEAEASRNGDVIAVVLRNKKFAALNVRLDLPECDVRKIYWQDNYITLAPGEERVVAAVVTAGMENPGAVTVSAWNSPVKRISIK